MRLIHVLVDEVRNKLPKVWEKALEIRKLIHDDRLEELGVEEKAKAGDSFIATISKLRAHFAEPAYAAQGKRFAAFLDFAGTAVDGYKGNITELERLIDLMVSLACFHTTHGRSFQGHGRGGGVGGLKFPPLMLTYVYGVSVAGTTLLLCGQRGQPEQRYD